MKINLKSLFLSGTIAGVTLMIVGGVLVPIIGEKMDEVLKNFNLPALSIGAMIFFAFVSIVNGIGVMGVYAVIRNSFKDKIRAITVSSLIYWFFHYFIANASLVAYGFMPMGLTVIGTAWGLLELIAGSYIGSLIYKSKE